MAERVCHFCGAVAVVGDVVGRDATCGACGRDLRCCVNCRHHDPRYHNACMETEAEPVADRDRRNFCEFFFFSAAPFTSRGRDPARVADARAKLAALFGEAPPAPPAPPTDARTRLEALFRRDPPPGKA